MPKKKKPTTAVQDHKENFKMLQRAFADGDAGVMECRLRSTNERVAVICAFSKVDGEIQMTPFAMFFNGNPYEMLDAPNPDGGFLVDDQRCIDLVTKAGKMEEAEKLLGKSLAEYLKEYEHVVDIGQKVLDDLQIKIEEPK